MSLQQFRRREEEVVTVLAHEPQGLLFVALTEISRDALSVHQPRTRVAHLKPLIHARRIRRAHGIIPCGTDLVLRGRVPIGRAFATAIERVR